MHAVGEQYGLPHGSQGEGSERRVALGPPDAHIVELGLVHAAVAAEAGGARGADSSEDAGSSPNGSGSGGSGQPPLSDEQLVALIQQHLNLDAAAAFAGSGTGGAGTGRQQPPGAGAAGWRHGGPSAAAQPGARGLVTVEEFVAQLLPLLEMEREAEVAQASRAGGWAGGWVPASCWLRLRGPACLRPFAALPDCQRLPACRPDACGSSLGLRQPRCEPACYPPPLAGRGGPGRRQP